MTAIDWTGWLQAPWVTTLIAAVVALAISAIALTLAFAAIRRLANPFLLARNLVKYAEKPARLAVPLVVLQGVWNSAPDALPLLRAVQHVTGLLSIAAFTWLGLRAVKAVGATIALRNPVDVVDNLRARRIQTQNRVLVRSLSFVVLLVGIALMLMTFPAVRQVGASLLASAGVAGLVAGIAARPVLGNLIAGLQIAVTQPIRLDDVVIVEGEWGRVEEITGTYVVLRIWDERRLIIPLQWFIEHPFQNWTRNSSEILGTVFIHADYRLPLEPLRAELDRVLETAPEWDRRVKVLQLTDVTERTIQIRVLVSARSSGLAFDLRCRVREALVSFIQREYPDCLPQVRMPAAARQEAAASAAERVTAS